MQKEIIIIGGGLSGLTLAYLLAKNNKQFRLLEASGRLGGRIETAKGINKTPLELGATWFAEMHKHLNELVNELDLTTFHQHSEGISLFQTKSFEPTQKFYVPASDQPSFRIAGGTQSITDVLASKIPEESILFDTKVTAISQGKEHLIVETECGKTFNADYVCLCIPPQLAGTSIKFKPDLPQAVLEILPTEQTWMAGSIKFAIEYAEPFWRNEGYSGMLFSHAGFVTEMYDHTNFEENKYGFTGFLNSGVASFSQEVRKEFVLKQLTGLFGEKAAHPLTYLDKVWNNENLISGSQTITRPHQNNGHEVFEKGYYDNRLFFGATETSAEFPGYMDGAVWAAKNIFRKLK